jgi:hypothetical protein
LLCLDVRAAQSCILIPKMAAWHHRPASRVFERLRCPYWHSTQT